MGATMLGSRDLPYRANYLLHIIDTNNKK